MLVHRGRLPASTIFIMQLCLGIKICAAQRALSLWSKFSLNVVSVLTEVVYYPQTLSLSALAIFWT